MVRVTEKTKWYTERDDVDVGEENQEGHLLCKDLWEEHALQRKWDVQRS